MSDRKSAFGEPLHVGSLVTEISGEKRRGIITGFLEYNAVVSMAGHSGKFLFHPTDLELTKEEPKIVRPKIFRFQVGDEVETIKDYGGSRGTVIAVRQPGPNSVVEVEFSHGTIPYHPANLILLKRKEPGPPAAPDPAPKLVANRIFALKEHVLTAALGWKPRSVVISDGSVALYDAVNSYRTYFVTTPGQKAAAPDVATLKEALVQAALEDLATQEAHPRPGPHERIAATRVVRDAAAALRSALNRTVTADPWPTDFDPSADIHGEGAPEDAAAADAADAADEAERAAQAQRITAAMEALANKVMSQWRAIGSPRSGLGQDDLHRLCAALDDAANPPTPKDLIAELDAAGRLALCAIDVSNPKNAEIVSRLAAALANMMKAKANG